MIGIEFYTLALIVYIAGFLVLVGRIYTASQIRGLSDKELIAGLFVAIMWVPVFSIMLLIMTIAGYNK